MPVRPLLALCAFFFVLVLSFPAFRGLATENFARETGRACGECHLDPSGGGELNGAGKAPQASFPFHRGVRFVAGFLHLLTAKIAIFLIMTTTAFILTFVVGPRLKARHGKVDPRKRDMTDEGDRRLLGPGHLLRPPGRVNHNHPVAGLSPAKEAIS